jgi:hypothetical protein
LALLIGLRLAEGDHHPVFRELDVLYIETNQLGSPEAACKPKEKYRSIPNTE